jgi:hypothetical protein
MMSDAALDAAEEEQVRQAFKLGETEEKEVEEEVAEEQEIVEEEEPQLSAVELEAREMGHTSKEDWIASGRPEEEWVTPYAFVKYGKLQKSMHHKIDAAKREFTERIDNLNKYHEAQRKLEIDALKAQQREAVELGDTEAYDAAQTKIEAIESQPIETEAASSDNAKAPEIVAWEKDNTWIFNPDDPKTILANARYNKYLAENPGCQAQDVLDYVDKEIAKTFPKQNVRREVAKKTTETSTRRSAKESKKLSMSDLTFEEKQAWNQMGQSLYNGDQDKFLQAVQDSRG